jgi:hypothetical protein
MRIRHTYSTVMLAAASAALASTLAAAPRAAADCISPCARRVNPGRATRHPSLGPLLISLLTVMWTGCATRASASLSVTEGNDR